MKKKNKKNTLKDILSKLKKPLMILSIVGNILFALFLIVGAIGAKKQQQQNKKEVETQQVNKSYKRTKTRSVEPEQQVVSLGGTHWLLNEKIYYIPINNEGQIAVNTTKTQRAFIDYYFDYQPSIIYDSLRFTGFLNTQYSHGIQATSSNAGVTNLITSQAGSQYYTIANNSTYGYYRDIYITGGSSAMNTYLIQWFYDNGTLLNEETLESPYTFKFSRTMNYNAPYGANINSNFVIGEANYQQLEVNISLPFFNSNDLVFNHLRLYYTRGAGVKYYDSQGLVTTLSSSNTNFYYFKELRYENILTGASKVVLSRLFETSAGDNVLTNKSQWTNANYQTLLFASKPNGQQITDLAQFNDYDGYSGGGFSSDTSILGVTTLLSTGFTGLLPILKVEILPNISIGLLLFLPLIAGIILLIIWLVKR